MVIVGFLHIKYIVVLKVTSRKQCQGKWTRQGPMRKVFGLI